MGVHYGIPIDAQYVAVVCPEDSTTVTLYDGANPPETLVSSGTPGKLYFGSSTDGVNISAGAYIESDKPIYLIYEASATNDEHNLLGLAL